MQPSIYRCCKKNQPTNRALLSRKIAGQRPTLLWRQEHQKNGGKESSFMIKTLNPKEETRMRNYVPWLGEKVPIHFWKQARWKDNICQSIWDKSEVLLGTFWGKCWEIGYLLGTHWKHSGNKLNKWKNEKFLHLPPPPPPKRKKLRLLECMMHHLGGCI